MEWIDSTKRLPDVDQPVLAIALYYDRAKNPIREMIFCSMDEDGSTNHYDELLDNFDEIIELWIPLEDVLSALPPIPPATPYPNKFNP